MANKRGFGSVYQQKKRGQDGEMVTLPTWWIKYSKGAQVFRESSGSYDQREAEKLLKKRLGDVVTRRFGGLKPERIKFAELASEVIEDYRDNERATSADVESRLRLHLLPELGDIIAADFGTRDLKRYIAKRRQEGAENATINRELAIVKREWLRMERKFGTRGLLPALTCSTGTVSAWLIGAMTGTPHVRGPELRVYSSITSGVLPSETWSAPASRRKSRCRSAGTRPDRSSTATTS